jgi:hypothetical protein
MNRLFGVARRRPGYVDVITPFSYGVTGYRLKWAPNFDATTFSPILTSSNVGYLDPTINPNVVDAQPMGGAASNGSKNIRIVFNPANPSYAVALTGTYNVSHSSNSLTPSTSQVGIVYPGSTISFASQPGVSYTVATVAAGTITLTANYTGTSNAATTATMSINDGSSFWLQFAQVTGGSETLVGAPTLLLPDSANHGQGIVTIHGTAPAGTSSTASLQIDLPRMMQNFHIHSEDSSNYLYVATEQNGPEQQLQPAAFPQFETIWGVQSSIWVRGATSSGTGAAVAFSATFTLGFPR